MAFNINEFIGYGLKLGGARSTLFDVVLSLPPGIPGVDPSAMQKFRFTCKATAAPASRVASIDVGYFGRITKVAGDRTFDDWDVTVVNDEDFLVRDTFEAWHNAINTIVSNRKLLPGNTYASRGTITQFGKGGNIIKQYDIYDLFPTVVEPMALSWDNQNQIQEFGVTFAYNYWIPVVRSNPTNINPVAI